MLLMGSVWSIWVILGENGKKGSVLESKGRHWSKFGEVGNKMFN